MHHPGGVRYNDVPAMAYTIDPSLFTCEDLYVRIETQGEHTKGQTVADLQRQTGEAPNAAVAMEVDVAGVKQLWVERVKRL